MTRPDRRPADLSREVLDSGIEAAMLAIETPIVVGYRASGICGFRARRDAELKRMITEKAPAFAASAMAVGFAALGGQRPDQDVAAAIHPLRSETKRNVRRLGPADTKKSKRQRVTDAR